jgi:thiol-disulfide isomerase/thioredoxin
MSYLLNRRPCITARPAAHPTLRIIPFLLAAAFCSFVFIIPCLPAAATDDFDTIYDNARADFRRGNFEQALRLYKKANTLKANADLECLWGIAQTYAKLGAPKDVLKTCEQLILASAEDLGFKAKAHGLRGNALFALATFTAKQDDKKLQEAESAFKEALKINPGLNQVHYDLGITLIRLNKTEDGIGELRAFVQVAGEAQAEVAKKIIANPRRAIEKYAPEFSVLTSDGSYVESDQLRGKVVLLDFWGIWCPPCLNAIPFLSDLAKKYDKEEFILLSIDVRDDEDKWRDFIEKNKMRWTHTFDKNSKMQSTFKINAFPSYILIDHEGIVRYQGKGSGGSTESDVSSAVKKALKAAKSSPTATQSTTSLSSQSELKQHQEAKTAISPVEGPALENSNRYAVRIPKPAITAKKMSIAGAPPALRSQPYTLQVKNWASFPDELFESAKELQPCKGTNFLTSQSISTRMEVSVLNEQEQPLNVICNMPRPEMLQSIFVVISDQLKIDKVHIQIRDRLTGNVVQSDPITLP